MDCHPLARHHTGGEPAPEAEKVRQHGVELHATVSLAAMQIQRHRHDGELGHDQHIDRNLAPTGVRKTVVEEVEYSVKHGSYRVEETVKWAEFKVRVSIPTSMAGQS